MADTTFEAWIEDGKICLPAEAKLPQEGKVYVVIPEKEKTIYDVPTPTVIRQRRPRICART